MSNFIVNSSAVGYASGKMILVGEHSVVYGAKAIAVPLDIGIRVAITKTNSRLGPVVRGIGSFNIGTLSLSLKLKGSSVIYDVLSYLRNTFGEELCCLEILVEGNIPRGHGLGSSAAFSVAVLRGLQNYLSIKMSYEEINYHACMLETIFHGRPSGIDHTVILKNQPISFIKEGSYSKVVSLQILKPMVFVIGLTGAHEGTKVSVEKLANRREKYNKIFDQIFVNLDKIANSMEVYLQNNSYYEVGELMNIAHGLLCSLGVSTLELDKLCSIARNKGALGAKLTGAGGGGAVIALAQENAEEIVRSFNDAGFKAFTTIVNTNINEEKDEQSESGLLKII